MSMQGIVSGYVKRERFALNGFSDILAAGIGVPPLPIWPFTVDSWSRTLGD